MARDILNPDPNPAVLLDELYFQVERDFKGLPLGNVSKHAQARLHTTYLVLCLVRLLHDLGRIGNGARFEVTGAAVQDKQTSHEFPAAHVLPCDLRVQLGGAAGTARIYELFRAPLNGTWIQRDVFGRTDRVHRLTNYADSRCEQNGMCDTFASACGQVALGQNTDDVFTQTVMTGYRGAAWTALRRVETALTEYERGEMTRKHLLDARGRPAFARPEDTRLRSPDPAARAAAKNAVVQILQSYAHATADPGELEAAAKRVAELRREEAKLN
jgi:hypothetical protein